MIQRNVKIPHVHPLEELILLKCPYYPRQSTDLINSPSKFPGYFSRTRTNNCKICME